MVGWNESDHPREQSSGRFAVKPDATGDGDLPERSEVPTPDALGSMFAHADWSTEERMLHEPGSMGRSDWWRDTLDATVGSLDGMDAGDPAPDWADDRLSEGANRMYMIALDRAYSQSDTPTVGDVRDELDDMTDPGFDQQCNDLWNDMDGLQRGELESALSGVPSDRRLVRFTRNSDTGRIYADFPEDTRRLVDNMMDSDVRVNDQGDLVSDDLDTKTTITRLLPHDMTVDQAQHLGETKLAEISQPLGQYL